MTQTTNINEKLLDEAEAWIVRLRSDSVTIDDKKQFSKWLNTSQEHIMAFDYASELWEQIGAMAQVAADTRSPAQQVSEENEADDQRHYPPTAFTQLNKANPSKHTAQKAANDHDTRKSPKLSWWQGFALASCYALVALAFTYMSPSENIGTQRFETAAGEFRTIDLEDGSILELNTKSTVEIHFSKDKRELTLIRGEAYFAVEPDKSRPFIVDVGNGSVTAVGTAFNIRRDNELTSVTVTEGIVDVELAKRLDDKFYTPEKRRVTIDQQVKLGERGLSPVRNITAERSVAWRDKTLVFNNTDLPSAVKELSRYLKTPVVADASLADITISGTFSLAHPDDTLDAIVTSFNLSKVSSSTTNFLYPKS